MAYLDKKILIVEDEKPLLSSLRERFESEGFKVFVAEDGEAGFEAAKKEIPDIILIDILLPKVDGIAMARMIKGAGVKALMIFLTNLGDAEHVVEAFGASSESDYLVKSDWNINDVVARVKERLNLK